jgi:hypothetical protein
VARTGATGRVDAGEDGRGAVIPSALLTTREKEIEGENMANIMNGEINRLQGGNYQHSRSAGAWAKRHIAQLERMAEVRSVRIANLDYYSAAGKQRDQAELAALLYAIRMIADAMPEVRGPK